MSTPTVEYRWFSDTGIGENAPKSRTAISEGRQFGVSRSADTIDSGFWMDVHTVTNAEFAAFVQAAGYCTVAKRPIDPALYPDAQPDLLKPGSVVFFMPSGSVDMCDIHSRWAYVPGASWRHPDGPASTLDGRGQEPVVHVAFEDVAAYAAWEADRLDDVAQGREPVGAGGLRQGNAIRGVVCSWPTIRRCRCLRSSAERTA